MKTLIKKAYETLEVNKFPHVLDTTCNYRYYSIKIDNDYYRWVEECRGYGVKNFMINDTTHTDVKDKFVSKFKKATNEIMDVDIEDSSFYKNFAFLSFSECNGLCGERKFELNSIFYEYFLKPIGVTKQHLEQFCPQEYKAGTISHINVEKLLDNLNIKYEIILKTLY